MVFTGRVLSTTTDPLTDVTIGLRLTDKPISSRSELASRAASTDPAYTLAFDFDNSGTINALDYNAFRSRFGTTVP